MKLATKYIFTFVGIEIVVALITFTILFPSDFRYFISNIAEYILLGVMAMLVVGYFLGEKVPYERYGNIRILWGIGIQFLLLFVGILVPWIVFNIREKIFEGEVFIILLFYFLMFGGLQTLLLGLWLGYKLSKITGNEKNIDIKNDRIKKYD